MKHGNVIVGQSGGPTAVINSSLAGVFKTARDRGANKVFGMQNGIEGFLEGRYVDLSEHIQTDLHIELLKRTPSAYLGSCRYKLPEIEENEEIYIKIFKMLNDLEIEHFFYIGGNDSMDTIKKLSHYGEKINSSIRFMGVPKTIDNDLAETDHTPGYGSAAKFIATVMKEIIKDANVYGNQNIHIVEIMGRNAGWLTASAALSKAALPKRLLPNLGYASTLLSHGSNVPVFSLVQPTGKTATTSVSVSLKLKTALFASSLPRKTRLLMY